MDALDKETDRVSEERADLGAQQNALEHRISVTGIAVKKMLSKYWNLQMKINRDMHFYAK